MTERSRRRQCKHPSPHLSCECERSEDILWQCRCYEDVQQHDWFWHKEEEDASVVLSNNGKDVLFHPFYSSGTAVVRGTLPLRLNHHYYWEIKMLSNLYGTDVMIGVGTTDMAITNEKLQFCSLLGLNSQSWGFSYYGSIQHNRMRRSYGTRFDKGSIVGVHLDMCKGTLEYYLNRRRLGIAFKDLQRYDLYPMMCSTAAKSAMRLCCAVIEEPSLQLMCLQVIRNYPCLSQIFSKIPGLKRAYEKKYFWITTPEILAKGETINRKMLPLDVLICEKRPLLLQEARADPDHVCYREVVEKKLQGSSSLHTACYDYVYATDSTESGGSESEHEEHYCENCNIRLRDHSDAPLCLACIIAL